jgi:hypothetical protein
MDVMLSEKEALGIAEVLMQCEEIVRDTQCGDDSPSVFDPEQVQTLLDNMKRYFDMLRNRADDVEIVTF